MYSFHLFINFCSLLFFGFPAKKMSHNPKEAEKEMEKAIFISADCWLEVFHLLSPSQLGLGIALINRRFDYFVDEHFKTRKWTLDNMQIGSKIGENGTEEMEIVNSDGKKLPIPQNPLPNKVIGFGSISIYYIDQNVVTFLGHFHRFFPTCATMLNIITENVRILEFVMLNIWPMLKETIHWMCLNPIAFRQIRQFAPSMLNDCPSLRVVDFDEGILPEFPPDDSDNASDDQAVAKWLFSPNPDNLPKQLSIKNSSVDQWLATIEQIKTAFSIASSPVAFGIFFSFPPFSSFSVLLPFELTNEFTGEQLALSQNANTFTLIRRSIVHKTRQQQQKMVKELDRRLNQISISIKYGGIDDGLLDAASAGPSGDQKQ